jgi:hypothetical protein
MGVAHNHTTEPYRFITPPSGVMFSPKGQPPLAPTRAHPKGFWIPP